MHSVQTALLFGLFHSLWISGILWVLYAIIVKDSKHFNPGTKKGLLLLFLAANLTAVFIFFIAEINDHSWIDTEKIIGAINLNESSVTVFQSIINSIAVIYALILVVKCFKLYTLYNVQVIQVQLNLIEPGDHVKKFTNKIALSLGITRKVTIWFSSTISSPITVGFIKPLILFPVSLVNNLTQQETESLILHELKHIYEKDYLFNWFLVLCETIFFYNPFILKICTEIKLEREKLCDKTVLQFKYPAITYAETLLKAARHQKDVSTFALAAVTKETILLQRIQWFLKNDISSKQIESFRIIKQLTVSLLLCFLSFTRFSDSKSIENLKTIQQTISGYPKPLSKAINKVSQSKITKHLESPSVPIDNSKSAKNNLLQKEFTSKELSDVQIEPEINIPVADIIPASFPEPFTEKEMILTEEDSKSGSTVKKVYRYINQNGINKWVLSFVITETKSIPDSIQFRADSLNTAD